MAEARTSTVTAAMESLMLDSEPATQTPQSEQPLLERLTHIRTRLVSIARSSPRASAVASAGLVAEAHGAAAGSPLEDSVLDLAGSWHEVKEVVKQLTALRSCSGADDVIKETEGGMHIDTEVDLLLDDVVPMFFQLWSQAGKVSPEMYRTYVQLAKMLHSINKLYETGLFTSDTTAKLRSRLAVIGDSLGAAGALCCDSAECYHQGERVLRSKLEQCVETLNRLQAELDAISPALHPIHDRLVEIKLELEALLARKNPHSFSLAEVQILQDELREIDSARIDGKYIARDGSVVAGQASVIQLLEACFDDVHELLAAREAVGGENPLRPVYEDLVRIKGKLERLQLVGHWTLKSGDLIPIQMKLGEIDNMRVDGKFMDESGGVPQGQAVLHFLLHKCYRLIYKLQTACEPVADSLMPVYNQLVTLQKCLNELKRWRVSLTPRELVPYQMKLASLDGLRVDGKFLDEDGDVPEGQGTLHDLLNDCYDLLRQLQMQSSDAQGAGASDDEDAEDDGVEDDDEASEN